MTGPVWVLVAFVAAEADCVDALEVMEEASYAVSVVVWPYTTAAKAAKIGIKCMVSQAMQCTEEQ